MSKLPLDWLARSHLTARQLALLVELHEKRSVFQAAEAIHMTQPAASKLLQTVESALGVQLFERHSRGVIPTAYGDILVRHARGALAEFRHAHEEVEALRSGVAGEAFLGTVVTSATNLVPMAVARLKASHPRIRVNIEMGFSEEMVRGLLDRRLDVIIARLHTSQDLMDLAFEALVEEPHGMIARKGHPLARVRELAWCDLVQQVWVLPPPGNVLRDHLTRFFLEEGVDLPHEVVETASLPIITSLLRLSDMVAPLALEVVRPYCETGLLTILPIRLDVRLGAAGIVTRHERDLSPGAIAMLNALREVAGELYPDKTTTAP
jgi:DNA-binding transcriptional LysR family regulator